MVVSTSELPPEELESLLDEPESPPEEPEPPLPEDPEPLPDEPEPLPEEPEPLDELELLDDESSVVVSTFEESSFDESSL